MANKKTTQLPELTVIQNDDWIYVIDKSDLTDGANGTSKKVSKFNLALNGAQFIANTEIASYPTGDVYTLVTEAKTYTDWGGIIVGANKIAILMRINNVFSSSQNSLDISGKVNVSDIINNLTSTETVKPLSAAQGKILSEDKQVFNLTKEIGGIFTLTTAIAAVPVAVKKIGLNILFNSNATTTEEYVFTSDDIANFSYLNYWKNKKLVHQTDIKLNIKVKDYSYINSAIGADGGAQAFTLNWGADFFDTKEGDRWLLKSRLGYSGSTQKRQYAFYNGEPSASTFISGASASTDESSINEIITVPSGATVIGMTWCNLFPYEITNINDYDFVTEAKLNSYFIESKQTVSNTSIWGILGNGQGMLEEEAREAFGKVYTSEQVYCGYVDYNASTPFYIILYKMNGDLYGYVNEINANDTKYKLFPITSSAYAPLESRKILGYASIKGSGLKRAMYGLYVSKCVLNFNEFEYKYFLQQPKQATQIVLWGDSLTSLGSGYGSDFSAPSYLTSVYGIGGETSLQIAARTGAIPYEINTDFTIPAGTTPVSIDLRSSWTKTSLFPRENYGMNACSIKGIEGTLIVTSAGVSATFTRTTAGNSLLVKKGEKIISNAAKSLSNEIHIIWIGQNGGYTNEQDLVNQFTAITNTITSNKYIVISAHLNTTDALELLMDKTFGSKYINMRQWCVNYGLSESGITELPADTAAIALGNCPPSLLSDGVHFVAAAKTSQVNLIKNKLVELKMID